MPGIVGIIGASASASKPHVIEAMLGCMRHENFYNSGIIRRENLGVATGWTCHQNSFCDRNPVWSRSGKVCLIFTGEHYKTRNETGEDDTSRFADSYEERGEDFLRSLNGWFSGVILDLRTEEVVLFNDRYGLGRIYYHQTDDGFYFASEAKSLLKILPGTRSLDMNSFAEFFCFGSVLQNRSLFSNVSLLPGGSMWSFGAPNNIKREKYFDPGTWENQPQLSESEYYQKIHDTFDAILPGYFRGEVPAALSLTGGLDSRMIIACLNPAPDTLPCFSFGGMYRQCADVVIAEKIARATQQHYQVISVDETFFAEFPRLAEETVYFTDGTMDVSGSVELFANRMAREISPIRVTGNYGSEILRGNVVLKPSRLSRSIFNPDFSNQFDRALGTYESERQGDRTSFIAFKQVPWHHYARLALEQSQLTIRSPFLDNELVAVACQAPSSCQNKELCTRLVADCNPMLADIPTERGLKWLGRAPGKFRTFCEELMPRAEYLFDYGMPHWLAKVNRLLAPLHLEQLFLGRQKFYHFRKWYQGQLGAYLKDVLLDNRSLSRPYLDRRRVEHMVKRHVDGTANYTVEIHKLLTAELIQRSLLEKANGSVSSV